MKTKNSASRGRTRFHSRNPAGFVQSRAYSLILFVYPTSFLVPLISARYPCQPSLAKIRPTVCGPDPVLKLACLFLNRHFKTVSAPVMAFAFPKLDQYRF